DEPQIRKLLQINLESNDYKVIQAATGNEGISLCASHTPDLVLLDIGLPDKSGQEVLLELREWYHNPIIMLIIKKNNELLKLTSTEYNLLALFAKNEGKVLTHQYILREIWGIGYQTETQYLRVFVGTLRKKIESDYTNPLHIITESGV
ncbi:unnamed protein product, partial [Darwinula stevensoni]